MKLLAAGQDWSVKREEFRRVMLQRVAKTLMIHSPVRITMDGMFGICAMGSLWPGFAAHAVDRGKLFPTNVARHAEATQVDARMAQVNRSHWCGSR